MLHQGLQAWPGWWVSYGREAAQLAGVPTKLAGSTQLRRKSEVRGLPRKSGLNRHSNGLRMVETLLLREYGEDDVVTSYVENLDRFVGPETRVLAIHAHNPLGISYATDVYKYPLHRFAGFPERLIRRHLYLDFTGHRRRREGLPRFERDIVPEFLSTRGLNMVEASELYVAPRAAP